ncbi:MAG: TRAP transporter substrate-binding protein DctP, partial [Methylobacteriaceae bacterium]|nr:TRAP transporter substrate-binding protein DctP [Methylobacteriaceae bacterium]
MGGASASRRAVLAGSAASVSLFAIGRARAAADFSYKFATNLPVTHPLNIRLQESFDRIKKDSNGAFEINLFPNNQLGADTDVLGQLRSGAVEFFTLSGIILSTLVPTASISGIGFAMPDYDTVWKAMDGELGGLIRAEIAKANIYALEKIWDNGFRHITMSTKPIRTPDDLRDVKMRV